ncbi:uncharacterized protein LOC115626080 [Scaptodrosophila lebanonensis]|uniref:Uncharacterized protein LOC115626080 n=1 Tax=Drosophila lebanonensis TaxID=7225 RepID=A0A6J2TQ07_DROLE|nr:uncharacterized protein LOC115626080 [Scaptodrosophila lebanonensis]
MAPSQVDYLNETSVGYTHKKFKTVYTHKKFGKCGKQTASLEAAVVSTTTPLFRPYALDDNRSRKRRPAPATEEMEQQRQQLPPTPPLTPPQYKSQPQQQQIPAATPTYNHIPLTTQHNIASAPTVNHQAFALMLQKQRAVLHMRQLLNINPDANTWPLEWRNALYALLQQ